MTQKIAPCGIDCGKCDAFTATQAEDWAVLAQTAKKWSEVENTNYEPKDLLCDGCSGPRVHKYCATCGVRECSQGKGLQVCSQCTDYSCSRLEEVWSVFTSQDVEVLKGRLEEAKLTL